MRGRSVHLLRGYFGVTCASLACGNMCWNKGTCDTTTGKCDCEQWSHPNAAVNATRRQPPRPPTLATVLAEPNWVLWDEPVTVAKSLSTRAWVMGSAFRALASAMLAPQVNIATCAPAHLRSGVVQLRLSFTARAIVVCAIVPRNRGIWLRVVTHAPTPPLHGPGHVPLRRPFAAQEAKCVSALVHASLPPLHGPTPL